MAADRHRLPQEILDEIFSRSPVQSLLQFRLISKSLKSIIDSHNFTNLHLKNSRNFNLILRYNSDIYQLDFTDPTISIIPLNHPFSTNIEPFSGCSTKIVLIGSCNGLICLTDPNEITIWNPNTRQHRIIPLTIRPQNLLCVHGFCFDRLTSDYKLLRISCLGDLHYFLDPQVRLFSSKTNSWKIIPSMPYSLKYQAMGVFVENSLHWVMTWELDESHPCFIVAFNLTLETFNVVPLPAEIEESEEANCNEIFKIAVAILGGCLCLTVNYKTTRIDVWVLKEYDSRDSWCKLFTLVKLCFTPPLNASKPLGYSSDGSKVLLVGCPNFKLSWYDLKSENVIYVEGIPDFDEAMICVGSLVPPSFPVDNCRNKENHTSKSDRREA